MTDHPVYVNRQLVSANNLRSLNRIERELAEVEFELVRMRFESEMRREAQFEKEWQRRHGR